jgi:ring-1,2-phenylacetyl-CoA epoxidase subunit PaaC
MNTQALLQYTLHLADNALILGQRNAAWTGHGPILEQDIAMSNIALDLIGQSRNLYQYAADQYAADTATLQSFIQSPIFHQVPGVIDEDDFAFLRDGHEFYHVLLVEHENGDWAQTILRQFLFSNYQQCLYEALSTSTDQRLAAIAEKSLKETAYHLRWSSEWVIRLGDGTEESHRRLTKAVAALYMFQGELYLPAPYELELAQAGIAINPAVCWPIAHQRIEQVFKAARLVVPQQNWTQTGGKLGKHTEALGYILSEMQFMQRTYPNAEW